MEHIVLPIFQLPCTPTWEIASFVANVKPAFPDWNSVTGIFSLFSYLLFTILSCFMAFPYLPVFLRNLRLVRKGTLVLGYYVGSRMMRFVSYDGQEVCFRTYSRFRYKIGRKFWVIYNPDRPSEAEIALRFVLWSFPISQICWLLLPVILLILLVILRMYFYPALLLAMLFGRIIAVIITLCFRTMIRLPAAPSQRDEDRDQTTPDENKPI